MKLVDADALKAQFEYTTTAVPMKYVVQVIERAPTIEPKQGEWIDTDVQYQDSGDVERRCSICGYGDRQSPSAIVPYCWHCGAKMKEGEQK